MPISRLRSEGSPVREASATKAKTSLILRLEVNPMTSIPNRHDVAAQNYPIFTSARLSVHGLPWVSPRCFFLGASWRPCHSSVAEIKTMERKIRNPNNFAG